jgi:group I intron endonuclease
MHRIYMTTNLVNGKKYVGRCSKDARWEEGYIGSGRILKQAIKKYGHENFKREILEELPDKATLREAIDLEKAWLLKLDCKSSPDYYNMSNDTGGMGAGDKHTDETKEKIRERMKEFYGEAGLPPEWRENVANAARGRIPWNKGLVLTGSDFYNNRRKPRKFSQDDYLRVKELYDAGMPACRIAPLLNTSHHVIMGMIRRGGPAQPQNKGRTMSDEQKMKIAEAVKQFHKNKKEN